MTKLQELRKRHHTFVYKKYSYSENNNDLEITFSFFLHPDIYFSPKIVIKNAADKTQLIDKKILNNLIFHIGLMEIFSYWKSTCAPEIKIAAGSLNSNQIDWLINLLNQGMGEFFYQNKIDFTIDNFVSITSRGQVSTTPELINVSDKKHLTLIGGGKDSIVSIEVLKKLENHQLALVLNPSSATESIIKQSGLTETIIVNREIDKKLLELNKKGYLNGHTPFSAYLGFLSLLVASLFKCKNIVVSNERSSNEENAIYLNKKINHQYSKSFEFEKSFRNYTHQYISPSLNYFSLVRSLWEIQISKIFARYPQYFQYFKSCNQKQKQWCCQCPKCLSVFILLSPFLKQKTISIFDKDLYEDLNFALILEKLTGLKQPKPFECVGTKEEIIIGLYLSIKQYDNQLPKLLKFAKENIIDKEKNLNQRAKSLLQSWGNDEFLSELQIKTLKKLAYA
ncbi:hypothetical protein ACFL18_01695 [Patescibacteria group bacterium]